MYYLGQELYTYNLVVTDLASGKSAVIQEYLPSALQPLRNFESFTAYDAATRNFWTVAVDFPSVSTCTIWKSTINEGVNASTPLITQLELKYPVSQSPAPLNVAHLVLSRLIVGPSGRLFATFLNGEIHEVDLENKKFSFKYALISDELQLSETHPYMTWGHVRMDM